MNRQRRFVVALAASLLAGPAFWGCLSKPSLVTETFAIEGPAEKKPAPPSAPVLVIRKISVSPAFQSREFVYRKGEHQFEKDAYAHFLASPERMLEAAILDYLRSSGRFRSVVTTGTGAPDELAGRITVAELSGDFRDPASAKAVLEIECSFAWAAGAATSGSLERNYQRAVPLPARTAAALASGWNRALEEIMVKLSGDLASFAASRPRPE